MNIVDKCFPDIQEIDKTIELYKETKYAYIKQEILSGKHDERLNMMMEESPLIPLLFLSGFKIEPVMVEGLDLEEFNFNDETRKVLTMLYNKEYADHWMEYCVNNIDEQVYDIHSSAVILFEPGFYLELFKEDVYWLDEYAYCLEYTSVPQLKFLYAYWLNLITKQKETYKKLLDDYLGLPFYEDGEELVDLDDL